MSTRDGLWTALGILGLLLVLFFCLGESHRPVATTAPSAAPTPQVTAPVPVPPPAPSRMPSITGEVADGRLTLSGAVPDEATRGRLVAEARSVYGPDRVTDRLTVEAGVASPAWLATDAPFAALRTRQISAGRANFDGQRLVLTGQVTSQALRDSIEADARKLVGSSVTIDNQLTIPPVAQLRANLDRLLAGKRIEFGTGSATILPAGQRLLDEVVPLLQQDPTARIEVAGHTDNTGDADRNLQLSQARANATLEYLVAKGVARERLAARGYGQDKPLTDNNTEEGRLHNRRIEFNVRSNGGN